MVDPDPEVMQTKICSQFQYINITDSFCSWYYLSLKVAPAPPRHPLAILQVVSFYPFFLRLQGCRSMVLLLLPQNKLIKVIRSKTK